MAETINLGTITVTGSDSRGLTAGEIAMLRPYFGDSMNYDAVKIQSNGIIFQGAALSVGGNIYFDPDDYIDDFSNETLVQQTWFVHEAVHIWQSQQGYNVFLNGLVLLTQGGSQYDYKLDPLNPVSFNYYNIESQADMIAHNYAYTHASNDEAFKGAILDSDYYYLTQGNNISILNQTVEEFMNSNHDSSWLPNSWFAADYIRDDIPYTKEKNIVLGEGNIAFDGGKNMAFSASIINGENVISGIFLDINGNLLSQESYFFNFEGLLTSTALTEYSDNNAITTEEALDTFGTKTFTTVSAYSTTGDLIGKATSQALSNESDSIYSPNTSSPSKALNILQQTQTNNVIQLEKTMVTEDSHWYDPIISIGEFFSEAYTTISSTFSDIYDYVGSMITSVYDYVSDSVSSAYDTFTNANFYGFGTYTESGGLSKENLTWVNPSNDFTSYTSDSSFNPYITALDYNISSDSYDAYYDSWSPYIDYAYGYGNYPDVPQDVIIVGNKVYSYEPVKSLIIDLDGDGVEIISKEQSNVWFDNYGNGELNKNGWVGADDGLLVVDENSDGKITQKEMVFASVTTGY
ncbi:MAG: hypothetical protein PHQ90_12150, partial [Sulfuricurvum sp.]|nr:hypothetical protein [Sulfuricurvum sp.]